MKNTYATGPRSAFLRWTLYGLVICLAGLMPRISAADHDDDDHGRDRGPAIHPPNGNPVEPQRPDRELREIVRDIDNHRIEASIRKLVSFGTRHTESSQTDPNQGIGAAINYVFTTLQGYAATSNGRMTVALQTYHQPFVAGTILNPNGVDITNVVATLRGSADAESDLRRVGAYGLAQDPRHQPRC